MLRALLCGFVGLALVAGTALAEDKKADAKDNKDNKGAQSTFVSWKDGTLTVKHEGKNQELKIPENVKVYNYVGDDRKEVALKDAFRDVKADTPVMIQRDGDKITAVIIGSPKKGTTKDK